MSLFDEIFRLSSQKEEAEALTKGNDDMDELARAEVEELTSKLEIQNSKLKELLVPKDPNDERNAIVEIRAAAGGDESSLFAAELDRMYAKYAEMKGYKL